MERDISVDILKTQAKEFISEVCMNEEKLRKDFYEFCKNNNIDHTGYKIITDITSEDGEVTATTKIKAV